MNTSKEQKWCKTPKLQSKSSQKIITRHANATISSPWYVFIPKLNQYCWITLMLAFWWCSPDGAIMIMSSWWCHPDSLVLTVPSRCCHPNTAILQCLLHGTNLSCCPDAAVLMLPSCAADLILLSWWFHPEAAVLMMPSWSCCPDSKFWKKRIISWRNTHPPWTTSIPVCLLPTCSARTSISWFDRESIIKTLFDFDISIWTLPQPTSRPYALILDQSRLCTSVLQ